MANYGGKPKARHINMALQPMTASRESANAKAS